MGVVPHQDIGSISAPVCFLIETGIGRFGFRQDLDYGRWILIVLL
jgi:hypothetical protein